VSTPTAHELREESLGSLLARLGDDASLLVRQEIALARAELGEKAAAVRSGVPLLVVATVFALAAVGAGVAAAICGISNVLPDWASALIVMGAAAVLAALLGMGGALRLRAAGPPVPERAITTAKETPRELIG
jgi:membrane protein